MPKEHDLRFRKDLLKLFCLFASILGSLAIFVITPALCYPTLLALVTTTLLSPWMSVLERHGYSKKLSIVVIFTAITLFILLFGLWGIQICVSEWSSIRNEAPRHLSLAVQKLRDLEMDAKSRYSFLNAIPFTDSILAWCQKTGEWFVHNGAGLMGALLSWILLIPPITFVLLNEGRTIRRSFFRLVPNRFFESFFLMTTDITNALADYIRAKLWEAVLLSLMVTIGLRLVGAPYVIVLGLVAGITNIIPYIGPVLGAIPTLFIVAFETQQNNLIIPVILVYLFANIIDSLFIFPIIVAKLINLHPLMIIFVVAIGQEYYGLIGMLISIPVATVLKVIFQETYFFIYESRR